MTPEELRRHPVLLGWSWVAVALVRRRVYWLWRWSEVPVGWFIRRALSAKSTR